MNYNVVDEEKLDIILQKFIQIDARINFKIVLKLIKYNMLMK